ncbi:MAG: 2-C-methyl-D-erythritol 2,4-cyclodiphosphate synthase [Candidatus Sumerlaeaceae bacterium]
MNLQPAVRVGNGFDVHALVAGRRLVLGGVEIPFIKGLDGHSDADVVLHAITDAILGALAEGDIGKHFPNTDERWRDCDSTVFLRGASDIARNRGYRISNIDATVLAERPKILPYVPAMIRNIGSVLGIPDNCVGLKATTMEKLGFVGREEGIAAMAVVLLERIV